MIFISRKAVRPPKKFDSSRIRGEPAQLQALGTPREVLQVGGSRFSNALPCEALVYEKPVLCKPNAASLWFIEWQHYGLSHRTQF
jgi:hypothetical protein